jgi:hypothetical protein
MGEACSTYGESICAHRVLLEKSERRRQLEKPRLSWKDTIKMDLREVVRRLGLDR